MPETRATTDFNAAIRTARDPEIPAGERAEMLMEIALGLQRKPREPADLEYAEQLYKEALQVCPNEDRLLYGRLLAGLGTALMAMPGGNESLQRAQECFQSAEPILQDLAMREEVAELEMNIGLVLQGLAVEGRARFADAVRRYHSALRVFAAESYPREFAIIQNNLATAYLSMTMGEEAGKMREALAMQAYEAALKVLLLDEHPIEYAMLQNNLGNALQYASSAHPEENNLRALQCYEEALKVRTRADRPLEYANTISNLANVLSNLPDDPEHPELGQAANLDRARRLYAEAEALFREHGEQEKARLIAEALKELDESFLGVDRVH
ncbi:hypothetical protein NRY68_17130 [Acidithiobacillus ferrooxidans]|uniref:hypothetical protein n=1 Tax=Acidithiobacillus ferrooxidans TaxID=920 RepID=UPI0021498181|nr:hypothetical protein [Acidithiobacillus ferrooxidans]MCR1347476.1 hypothetical protein [Acidithiobacillus ferrooxidans]MCR1355371.1 hypothetical protein [Acidithiobacillus ferrooxidans]